MVVYRVPIVIRGYVTVKYPDGKAVGDYVGGLPRDAEQEVLMQPPPVVCGVPLESCSVELAGPAQAGRGKPPMPVAAGLQRTGRTLRQMFAGY